MVNHIGKGEDCYNAFSSYGDLDDLGEDELLYSGIEDTYNFEEVTEGVDLEELSRAVELESTSVSPLLKEIKNLLARYGDPKIQKSIDIAISHMRAEDKVLLFSRYTDTVDALIEQYKKRFAINAIRIWHIHGAKGLLGFRR
jgi:ERCC4-related helicase